MEQIYFYMGLCESPAHFCEMLRTQQLGTETYSPQMCRTKSLKWHTLNPEGSFPSITRPLCISPPWQSLLRLFHITSQQLINLCLDFKSGLVLGWQLKCLRQGTGSRGLFFLRGYLGLQTRDISSTNSQRYLLTSCLAQSVIPWTRLIYWQESNFQCIVSPTVLIIAYDTFGNMVKKRHFDKTSKFSKHISYLQQSCWPRTATSRGRVQPRTLVAPLSLLSCRLLVYKKDSIWKYLMWIWSLEAVFLQHFIR